MRSQAEEQAMTDDSVLLEKRGQAFWITINRPEKRNALNAEVIAGLAKGYREAHDDKDVRVIVLTGAEAVAPVGGAAFHDNKVWLKKADADAIPTP